MSTTIAALAAAAPAALAAPADLDPSWGGGGLVIIPGSDRYEAQYAPLIGSGGKVHAAGLLRNASDRVFLDRLLPDGQVDPSYNEVHTTAVAPSRLAPVALLGDGRVVIAAGSSKDGRIRLERYTATGMADPTFGSDGKLTIDLGGTFVIPTGIVALSANSVLVSARSDRAGKTAFTLIKVTASGLDTSFGEGTILKSGIARAVFSKSSHAFDLVVLSNGTILVAGSLDTPGASGSDVALARFTSAGALDKSFDGDGMATYDLTGTRAADHAVSLVADATGAFAVAGPAAAGKGLVARFTSTGARDSGFAANGVQLGGFVPAGTTFSPKDVVLDAAGRMVVAAASVTGGGLSQTTRWAVSRLVRRTGSTLDAGFGAGGTAELPVCSNTAGFGPTGAAVHQDRIYVLGSCGAQGQVAVARLFGTEPFPVAASLDVSPATEAAGHERVTIAGIDPALVLKSTTLLQSAEVRSNPVRPNPVRPNPVRPNPVRPNPVRPNPVRPNPLVHSPVRPNPISSQILLSDFPLENARWEDILAGFIDQPIQTLTLADVFALNPLPPKVATLSLADVDLNRTPLRNVSAAALLLGLRPLNALPAPAGGWCDFLNASGTSCPAGVDPATSTLVDLELAGFDLTAYYREPLLLAPPTDLGAGDQRAPLAYVKLVDTDLAATPFGAVPAALVADLLACGTPSACTGTVAERQAADPDGFSTSDLGTLIRRLPIKDASGATALADVSLGDVLRGLVDPQAIPYEAAPLRGLLDVADLRDGDLQTWTTTFTADCSQASGLVAGVRLPDDARLIPGSATVTAGGQTTPVGDAKPNASLGGIPAYELASACTSGARAMTLSFEVEPGSDLGPREAGITVASAFGSTSSEVPVTVDDSRDPGDAWEDVQPVSTEKIVLGHIAHGSDVDYYTFEAPPTGSKVTFVLSHVPKDADFDLSVFGAGADVASSPVRPNPVRPNPVRPNAGVPDTSRDPTDPSILPPDTVQDIPVRPNPVRPNPVRPNELLVNSISRGSGDESASLIMREVDQGKQLTVAVSPYNGTSSEKPYVMRVKVATVPEPPECAAQAPLTTGDPPSTLPGTVPSDRRALILVNGQRLGARYGAAAAADVAARAQQLADATDGIVVPLDVPATDAEYKAWDAAPCSVDAANSVVAAINAAVDTVRARGNGLPQLRSILLVGADPIVPQARVTDRTVLANEADFADQSTFDLYDNPISRAQRQNYLLTDDPIGDFDPGDGFYVPDVALGRLIETPAQMLAQMDAFLTRDWVAPQRSFVAGYDFLADGTQQTFDNLVAGGVDGTLLNDAWTAAAAEAGAEAPGASYTAINGHYDNYRALSAAGNAGPDEDLLYARDVDPPGGSLLFTVGCHAGLNLSVAVASPDERETLRLGDWAERMSARAASYAAPTGYGYGDTEAVAYSEKIMADYAAGLVSGTVTTGQALMYAKHAAAASLTATDAYWEKASMETTYYGIPMYRVGENGGEGVSNLPPAAPSGGGVRSSSLETITPAFSAPIVTDRGTYWTADGQEPLVIQNRPVQPKTTKDVTPEGAGFVHGAMIEELVTHEITGVDHVIARPTIDLEANEPEPGADEQFFPAQLAGVVPEQTAEGRRDMLTLIAGQARGDVERLVDRASVRVFVSDSPDFVPPVIRRVDGLIVAGGLTVTVDVVGSDADGGVILYRTNASGAWHRLQLAPIAGATGRLGGGTRMPEGTAVVEAIVSVHDEAGNVGFSSNKVPGYSFERLIAGPGDPRIVFSPATPSTGYYETAPTATLDPGDHAGALFECSVDGGVWKTYDGPFTIGAPTEGEHVIRCRGSDGSLAADRFAVDTTGPVVTAEPAGAPNANGWYSGPVTVRFTCADAVSGVQSCPPDRTVDSEGAGQVVGGSATDFAGNSGSGSVTLNIDMTAPSITGSRTPAANAAGWSKDAVTVSWACSDGLSGIAFCSGPTTIEEAQDASVDGHATDRAGNRRDATVQHVRVDRTDPTVTVTNPLFVIAGKVRGDAGDADATEPVAVSGVDDVIIEYQRDTLFGTQRIRRGSKAPNSGLTITCDDALRAVCHWAADPPPFGFWQVTVTAYDAAGRTLAPPAHTTLSVN